jgi:hypothetical protein
MNLEDLKLTWQATDTHLRTTQRVQQQLVQTLVQHRSHGRLATLRRQLTTQALLLLGLVPLLLGAILHWNPFGLTTWYGMAPLLLWASCPLLAAGLTWRERQRVAQRTLATDDLRAALTFIIGAQQRYVTLLGWLGWLGVLAVFLVNMARATEQHATLSGLELSFAYGLNLLLAGLFSRWYWRRQWPRVTRTHAAELRGWLAELQELDEAAKEQA